MNKIYLITTAIQCRYTAAHLMIHPDCVLAATELEAAAIALNDQPEQTYIFWIEVCHPRICLFTLDQSMLIHQIFKAWQDLAEAETGHDTEWGYFIPIDRLAQTLHMARKVITLLLANLTQPEAELCFNGTAFTFHQPPVRETTGSLKAGHSYQLTGSTLISSF